MRPTRNRSRPLKDGEQNGSRTYQLILNSMQLLPVANISKIALLDNNIRHTELASPSKGKRKANTDTDVQPDKKKFATRSKSARNVTRDNEAMEIA